MEPIENPTPPVQDKAESVPIDPTYMNQVQAAESAYVQNWGKPDIISPQSNPSVPLPNNPSVEVTETPNVITQDVAVSNLDNFGVSAPTNDFSTPSISTDYNSDLAIISLVLALAAPLAGMVLAIVALIKGRRANANNQLARISIIVNFIAIVLMLGIILYFLMPNPGS